MADERPPPLEDEDAFYRRVSKRLEDDTGDTEASQAAKRRAVRSTLPGAPTVTEEGEILEGGLGEMMEIDRRVRERQRRRESEPSTEIRPLRFTDDPAMYLRGKIKSAITSRAMDPVRDYLDKLPGGKDSGPLPVSAGPVPGIIPWFINLARTDPKEAGKLFAEVTGSFLNPAVDTAISARDVKHAVETGNVPLGVLAGAGLIIPGYSGAKAVGKEVAGQLAKKGAPKIASHFSGAGTMEAALGRHTSVHAAEFDAAAINAYNKAHGTNYAPKDVLDVDPKEIAGADLYHASPVCKNLSCAKIGRAVDDLDQASADKVVQVINEAMPPTVSIENVPGYQKTVLFRQITDALDDKGYTWDVGTYNAADFGGAQNRNRMILRATREGELPPIPPQSPPEDWYSLIEDLIDDAPDLPFTSRTAGKDNWEVVRLEQAVDAGILDPSKPILTMGGSASRKIYAANAGGAAPTLTSTPAAVPRIILPDGRVKRLTGRMMARIMGLPDDYPIPETWGQAKKVLGNGIHGSITESIIAPLAEHGASLRKAVE